jgi:putative heme-binding domain-containing protein
VQDAFWTGLGDGLRQAGKNLRTAFPNPESFGAQKVEFVMGNARMIALNEFEFPKKRIEAARLLSYEEFEKSKDVLVKLLDARQPQEVQIAAVKSLAGFKNPEVGGILLQPWRNYTPEVREQVLTAIFARRERIAALLGAVESGAVLPAQISATRKASLLANSDAKLRERAANLFGQSVAGSRKEILEKYKPVLALKGDRTKGQKIFENNCMICHRLGDKGNNVGPNLETVRGWDVEKIMMNILDPNREVAPNFIAYDVELKDGSSLAGLIAAETANSITVKLEDIYEETVLRQNIEKISSSGLSLMPEGLEAAIPEQDMADLIAFILAK